MCQNTLGKYGIFIVKKTCRETDASEERLVNHDIAQARGKKDEKFAYVTSAYQIPFNKSSLCNKCPHSLGLQKRKRKYQISPGFASDNQNFVIHYPVLKHTNCNTWRIYERKFSTGITKITKITKKWLNKICRP